MTKISKNDKVIAEMINSEWYFLTKRPDIPPLPVWYKIKYSFLSKENKKIYGVNIPWACFWYKNNTEFYLHGKEYKIAIQNATKILYSKQKFNKHLFKLIQTCHDAKKIAEILNKHLQKNSHNIELLNLYNTAIDKYILSYIYGFITWCTPVLQNYAKNIIIKHKKNLEKIDLSPNQALSILIVPDKLTVYQKKEKDLIKLSKKYKSVTKIYKSEKYLANKHYSLHKEIKKFINKYYWVGFNYAGPILNYKTLVNELINVPDNLKQKLPSKKEIYRTCKFNKNERYIFYVLEMISYTKDLRNTTDDYIHYCLSIFYDVLSKRTNLTKTHIQFLWDDELQKILTGKVNISKQYVQKKIKFCAAFASSKTLNNKEYYIGKDAITQKEIVFRNSNQIKEMKSRDIIRGTIASTGIARGLAKIVNNLSEIKKVKRGNILVTGMTSPKYMPAIYNAAAILTDDGGLTCHAAIIARELKKPCIIGTKTATSTLRDGDLIEVNADRGLVKIIKKSKK